MFINKEAYDKSVIEYTSTFASNLSIWSILYIVVLGPVSEEIFFRGFIFNKLKSVHTPVTAIIISSSIFSLVHGTLIQILTVWAAGVVLAYFYHKTGNLKLSILLHILSNFISCIPLVLSYYKIDGYFGYLGILFDSILQFTVFYFVFHKLNNRIVKEIVT